MTRYSNSRGMMYTAPPAADEPADDDPLAAEVDADAEAERSEPTSADD